MIEENDKETGGFSRKVPLKEVYLPRIYKSGVKKPVKWKEEWDNPDYVEGPEEKRPIRSRRVQHRIEQKPFKGSMDEPLKGETFSKAEKKLLKKLKE